MDPGTSFSEVAPISFCAEPLNEFERALHARALRNASDYLKAEAALLDVICEVDRARLFLKFDLGSTFAYCVQCLKLSEAVACNFINVGRKSIEVPELKLAIQGGELSVSKARKIVPILSKDNQAEWIAKAVSLSQARLEREVAEASPETAAGLLERVKPIKNRRFKVEFSWTEDDHRLFRVMQDLVSESLRRPASIEETMRRALAALREKIDPVAKAERREARKQAAPVPFSSASSLSRDRSGRVTRRVPVPAAVVHAVNHRDRRRCQARRSDGSVCGTSRFIDLHHIIEVHDGGDNSLENLITLCRTCHHRWHRRSRSEA
jgi:HNH endonuclease